jgi:2-oxoglutarate ferredoxin oxidoreductase subunit alpha
MMQARWGSHGDFRVAAYSPWSVQEMFDLTILAFNVADRYRIPVLLLADEVVGHMVERVVIPEETEIERWERKRPAKPPPENGTHYSPFKVEDADLVPAMVHAGEGYRVHFTGLTHDERGYPDMSAATHHALVTRLVEKVERNAHQMIRTQSDFLEDARILVVAYGCTARSAQSAVRKARQMGVPAGMLRLVSIWPFPEVQLRTLAEKIDEVIVAEMNLGQISYEVERVIRRPVRGVFHAGGEMLPPEPILKAIQEAVR